MGNSALTVALLNPAVSLTLASAFLILWLHQRARRYLLWMAIGYLFACNGFLLQLLAAPVGDEPVRLSANLFFIAAGWALTAGVILRQGTVPPYAALTFLAFAGYLACAWFMLLAPSMGGRLIAINVSIGGMALLAAIELRRAQPYGPIEKLLVALALLSAANLLARPLIVFAFEGVPLNYVELYQSVFWTSTLVCHAMISLLLALSVFTAAAMDIVHELQRDSETDSLSGLLNRRGFGQRAAALLKSRRENGLPVALVLADLDHFKSINDRFGHDVGDSVIAGFGASIRRLAPDGAIAGRLGGEEFAVLLPLSDLPSARLFAEGLRTAFAAEAPTTASFGVAVYDNDQEMRPILRRADQALYAAKQAGRNRVCAYIEQASETIEVPLLRAV